MAICVSLTELRATRKGFMVAFYTFRCRFYYLKMILEWLLIGSARSPLLSYQFFFFLISSISTRLWSFLLQFVFSEKLITLWTAWPGTDSNYNITLDVAIHPKLAALLQFDWMSFSYIQSVGELHDQFKGRLQMRN